MASVSENTPLIAIVGPTASGKTSVSLQIAQRFGCEVIAADSRTVYRDLDIGTAKPTQVEQEVVKHWGIDLIDPSESFSAKAFQDYATYACQTIRESGKTPLIVGGTGLYIDAFMYNFQFPEIDQEIREKLEAMSRSELIEHCRDNNIELPAGYTNPRHLVGMIWRGSRVSKRQYTLDSHKHIVGIATEASILRQRIHERAKQMFSSGVVEEAIYAAKLYGWSAPGMSGNIYRIAHDFEQGNVTQDQAIEQSSILDWQLVKRQMTWFRRDPNILWVQLDDAEKKIAQLFEMNQ